jgi:hypothetical protein
MAREGAITFADLIGKLRCPTAQLDVGSPDPKHASKQCDR